VGFFNWNNLLAKYGFFLGIGHFINDLKDFLDFKFIGPDEEGSKKFWRGLLK